MVSNNSFKIFHFPACIFFFIWKLGFSQVILPTFDYEDCQAMGASYTYGNMVICYWIDFAPMQHSTAHCGMFDYAWVPDSGADYILHQLALQRGSSSGSIYHIGYTLNYTTPTLYTVIDRNGKPQSYSAFTSAMDPSNTCVGFIDGHWDDIPCTLYREAFCSLVIKFNYGDCRENGVSYTDGLKLYCYWIDTNFGMALGACGMDYSVIPNLVAQRVVNWLIKIRNLTTIGTYYIGYVENPTTGGVETHKGVTQAWTNWGPLEPKLIDINCITILQPYGFWKDFFCTSPLMSICSTVTEIIRCQTPVVNSGSTLISQTGDMYGDTCYYTCDIGHVLVSGNLTRTCLIDGTWDNSSPICNVIRCQTPVVNSGSTLISQTGDMYGDTCYYTCDIGHVLVSGNLTRTCLIDGTWDNSSPVCNVIRCQTPVVNSGSTLISQTGDMYGDTCYYTCDIGHVLVSGNLTRTCLFDGTWDNSSPVCNEIPTSDTTTDIVSTTDKTSTAESTTDKISTAGSTTDKIPTAGSTTDKISTSGSTTDKISTAESISSDMSTSTKHQQVSTAATIVMKTTYNLDIPETTTLTETTTYNQDMTKTTTHNQEITEKTTSVTSGTTSGFCICACSLFLNITIDIEQRIEELKKILAVNKDVLSSTIRRRTCADDPRPSSAYIGYTGALIIVAVFSLIIIIDIVNIYLFYKTFRMNKKSRINKL